MSEEKDIENKGIEPEQRVELERLATDFEPDAQPVGEPIAEESPGMSSGQMCAMVCSVGFGIVAGRRGAHWALSDEESGQLGEAMGAVLDKYVPDMEGGPEFALVVAAGMIVVPRIMVDRQLAEQEAANDGDQSTASAAE